MTPSIGTEQNLRDSSLPNPLAMETSILPESMLPSALELDASNPSLVNNNVPVESFEFGGFQGIPSQAWLGSNDWLDQHVDLLDEETAEGLKVWSTWALD